MRMEKKQPYVSKIIKLFQHYPDFNLNIIMSMQLKKYSINQVDVR